MLIAFSQVTAMKLDFVLTEHCIRIWMFALACVCAGEVAIAWQYRQAKYLEPAIFPATMLGIMLAIQFFQRKALRRQKWNQLLREALRQCICLSFPKVQLVFGPAALLSGTICCIATVVACFTILWFGGITLAYAANALQQYVIGERIFQLIPDPLHQKEDMSLAAIWDYQPKLNGKDKTMLKLNDVISSIYGPESTQMAHRFILLGENSRASALQKSWKKQFTESKAEFSLSIQYFERAVSLFKIHRDFAEQAEALSNIAYCQAKLEQRDASQESISKTLLAIGNSDEYLVHFSTIDRLALTESLLGHQRASEALYKKRAEIAYLQTIHKKFCPTTAQIASVLFGCFLLYRIFVPAFYACSGMHWRRKLS